MTHDGDTQVPGPNGSGPGAAKEGAEAEDVDEQKNPTRKESSAIGVRWEDVPLSETF